MAFPDPVVGTGQAGARPALVVSPAESNDLPNGLIFVVPVANTPPRARRHIPRPAGEGGCSADGAILCEQVRGVSRAPLKRLRGHVQPGTPERVDRVPRRVFGWE